MEDIIGYIGLIIAAMLAGVVNALAGGGTLISFPALFAITGLPIQANATNGAALVPGSLGAAIGFREELRRDWRLFLMLLPVGIAGGWFGGFLLAQTSAALFVRIVPFLILFATLVFAARDWITRMARTEGSDGEITRAGKVWGIILQFAVSTYGGYFGAGQGVMMLASLSIMGLRDIHRINGIKNALAVVHNSVAVIYLALQGLVIWKLAILMAAGALVGGYISARLSKHVNQNAVRALVIAIGLLVSAYLFLRA